MTNNIEKKNSSQRKFYYLLVPFSVLQIFNYRAINNLKTSSIEFKLHFGLVGLTFWALSILFFWVANDIYKKYGKRYYILAFLSIVIGIVFMSFPIYAYREIVKSDKIINALQQQADSLRKIGK